METEPQQIGMVREDTSTKYKFERGPKSSL